MVRRRIDEMPDDLAGPHHITDLDDGIDRLIGGTQHVAPGRGVIDGHDGPPEEHAGVADGALPRGQNLLPGTTQEIDTTVAGLPPLRRRLERANDDGAAGARRRGEGPGPGAGGVGGGWGLGRLAGLRGLGWLAWLGLLARLAWPWRLAGL